MQFRSLLFLCLLLLSFSFPSQSHAQSAVTVIFGNDVEAFETLLPCAASGRCSVLSRMTITDLIVAERLSVQADEAENNPPGLETQTGNGDPMSGQAAQWHGGNVPGDKNGSASANPQGVGVAGGNGIHGIANNPGQSGDSPSDFDGVPACEMHGGFNGVKQNCP